MEAVAQIRVPASSLSIRTTEARRGRARSVAGTLQLKLAAVEDPVREPIRSNDPVLLVSCPSRTGRYAVGDFSNARRLRDSLYTVRFCIIGARESRMMQFGTGTQRQPRGRAARR
jgi:hypothetical protein